MSGLHGILEKQMLEKVGIGTANEIEYFLTLELENFDFTTLQRVPQLMLNNFELTRGRRFVFTHALATRFVYSRAHTHSRAQLLL